MKTALRLASHLGAGGQAQGSATLDPRGFFASAFCDLEAGGGGRLALERGERHTRTAPPDAAPRPSENTIMPFRVSWSTPRPAAAARTARCAGCAHPPRRALSPANACHAAVGTCSHSELRHREHIRSKCTRTSQPRAPNSSMTAEPAVNEADPSWADRQEVDRQTRGGQPDKRWADRQEVGSKTRGGQAGTHTHKAGRPALLHRSILACA